MGPSLWWSFLLVHLRPYLNNLVWELVCFEGFESEVFGFHEYFASELPMWFKIKPFSLWREYQMNQTPGPIWTSEQLLPVRLLKFQVKTCRIVVLNVVWLFFICYWVELQCLDKMADFCKRKYHFVLMLLRTCKLIWLQHLLPVTLFQLHASSSNVRDGSEFTLLLWFKPSW